ncbi:unnamed protein product, partial [Ectocarpus sp. 13 AM-2016]
MRETEARVATVRSGLDRGHAERMLCHNIVTCAHDPLKEPSDRGGLDGAYHAILAMVKADNYARYKDCIVTQRQLRVSSLEAIWWMQVGLTMKTFFPFPSPANNAESRLHACLASLYVPVASYFAWQEVPWLWVPITYGYIARVVCEPRLNPQAFFILFVLRPFVVDKLGLVENRFTPGPPKRFAQSIGLVFAASSVVLAFLKQYLAMEVVAAGLPGASFLSVFCNFCIACIILGMAARFKILPATLCEACNIQFMMGSHEVG